MFQLKNIVKSLDDWYAQHSASLGYQESNRGGNSYLWFPDITAANCMTHFWAFKILCITEMAELRRQNSEMPADDNSLPEVIRLSNCIMRSTGYLTREEMKLFGIFSTYFPVHTVFQALQGQERIREDCSLLHAFAEQHRPAIEKLIELDCVSPSISRLLEYQDARVPPALVAAHANYLVQATGRWAS